MNANSNSSRSIWIKGLWILLGIAVFLRFYGLFERGLIYGDGISYWKGVIDAAENQNYSWYYAKPGHYFLIWFFSLPIGWKHFVPLLVSLFFGSATLVATYFLARRMFSAEVGLAATTLLALSPWHFEYSRISASQTTAIFFWTLALYFYWRSRPESHCGAPSIALSQKSNHYNFWMLIFTGLSMGYAFTCHYNFGLMPFMFLLFEFHFYFRFFSGSAEKNRDDASTNIQGVPYQVNRIFILFMAMLLPLTFFNALHIFLTYLGVEHIPIEVDENVIIFSYFQQIMIQLKKSTSEIWGNHSNSIFWFKLLLNNNGGVAFLLILAGLGLRLQTFWAERNIRDVVLITPIIIILIFLINSKYTAQGRSFSAALPLMAIISALALELFLKKEKLKPVFFAIPFLIMVSNSPIYISHIQITDPKNQITAFMKSRNIHEITVQGTAPQYYLIDISMEKVIVSPNLIWTRQQVVAARESNQRIKPEYLLSEFNPQELTRVYRCQPEESWSLRKGKSLLGFEKGNVERNWDMTPNLNLNLRIGIFSINECFKSG